MRFQTLQQWLTWQESLHPSTIDLGLERVRRVDQALSNDPIARHVITVGGTNGKGSTVAMLEAISIAAGYRVGAYTSPHLLRYNERIRVQGEEVSDKAICDAFERVDRARGEASITYFEFGTLAAFDIFRHSNLDIAILEVGLGGRLDAVNIIDADASIITSIDLDHTDWLGDTREKIAFEKFGIARAGRPLIVGERNVPTNFEVLAGESGAKVMRLGVDFDYREHGSTWEFRNEQIVRHQLPAPSLRGAHQFANASCALMAIQCMQSDIAITQDAIRNGLITAKIDARFQVVVKKGINIIIDVAHNPHGCKQLAENLLRFPRTGRLYAVVSMLADKDVVASVFTMVPMVVAWYTAGLDNPRANTGERMKDSICRAGAAPDQVHVYNSIREAYKNAFDNARANDTIVVFGSFYTVADVMQEMEHG